MIRSVLPPFAVVVGISLAASATFAAPDSPVAVGCSDATREGFVDLETHPQIAGCSGGWTVPGILTAKEPACARESGNCSANITGEGCAAEDLCAPGWHICRDGLEVQLLSPTGCDESVPADKGRFFVTRQGGTGNSNCGVGANDIYGCGTIGAPITGTGCAVLNRFSHNNCSGLPDPWSCYGDTNEALNVTKPGVERGGVLCCMDPDADGDRIPDTLEDKNGNGAVDGDETDPTNPDSDGDGLPDGVEDANLNGVRDPGETSPILADTDRDGVTDGVERGVYPTGSPIPGADNTNPLLADTDGDGLSDGTEDANRNGKFDAGETDPTAWDTDRDGLVDGWKDANGDGLRSPNEGEDLNLNGILDPGETDPRQWDTDNGGEPDGSEVKVTGHNPRDPYDDATSPAPDASTSSPDAGPADTDDAGAGGSADAATSTADAGTTDAGSTADSSAGTTDDNITGEGSLRYVGGGCALNPTTDGPPLGLCALVGLVGAIVILSARRRRRRDARRRCGGLTSLWIALLLATAAGSEARAQNQFSVLRLRPAASPLNYYTSEGARTLPHLIPSVGLYLHYDHDPLRVRDDATGEPIYDEVSYQLNMELMAAIGFWDRLELGIALPVSLTQDSGDRPADTGTPRSLSSGIGDLRLIPKARLFTVGPFSMAVVVPVELPTGDSKSYLGDGKVGVDPRAVLGLDWERFGGALNVGVRIRPQRQVAFTGSELGSAVDDEFFVSLGARAGVWPKRVDIILDGHTFVGLHETTQSRLGGEILGGVRGYLPHGLTANLAAGPGIGHGVGTPAFRVLAGLHYQYTPARNEPVAVADVPLSDLDSDGIVDERDRCPTQAEDRDNFEDEDGCPDLDNDQDGISDADDRCPNEREDIDGFEDTDGCPDIDNDQDGIRDADDRCPMHPETINQLDDDDGCPDSDQGAVQLKRDRILVPAVHFAVGKVQIMPQSQEVLEMVARLLAENPWIKRLRIEGHTDDRGSASYNQKLSEQRVNQVRYFLMQRGIDAGRIETIGFGESSPIVDNGSAEGRARNRRVEFVIVDPPTTSR